MFGESTSDQLIVSRLHVKMTVIAYKCKLILPKAIYCLKVTQIQMRGLHTSADDNMADFMQKFTYCGDYRRCDDVVNNFCM